MIFIYVFVCFTPIRERRYCNDIIKYRYVTFIICHQNKWHTNANIVGNIIMNGEVGQCVFFLTDREYSYTDIYMTKITEYTDIEQKPHRPTFYHCTKLIKHLYSLRS